MWCDALQSTFQVDPFINIMEWLLLLLFSSFHSLFLLFSCFKRWKVLKKIYRYFVRFTLSKFCCLFDLFSLFHRNNLEVWWWWRWRVERRFYKLTLLPAYLLLLSLSLSKIFYLDYCLSVCHWLISPFSPSLFFHEKHVLWLFYNIYSID